MGGEIDEKERILRLREAAQGESAGDTQDDGEAVGAHLRTESDVG